jgi:hypothetical protein|tara:strand:- start:204 stop:947 length:744 start_codon:yes stop_codon:yes gene_type:complete
MISVTEVYKNLKDFCNKDQKGFVTPDVFNSFAGLAQQEIFNSIFAALPQALGARRNNTDPGRDKSTYKQLEEDLAYFLDRAEIRASGVSTDGLLFAKPSDLSKIVAISLDDDKRTSVEILYSPEKADRILSSNLSTPSYEFPVALVSGDLEVFPNTVSKIWLTYYRQPRATYAAVVAGAYKLGELDKSSTPTYSVLVSDEALDIEIASPVNCRNFDLPEHYRNQLITSMSKLIGVSLRDDFLLTKTA